MQGLQDVACKQFSNLFVLEVNSLHRWIPSACIHLVLLHSVTSCNCGMGLIIMLHVTELTQLTASAAIKLITSACSLENHSRNVITVVHPATKLSRTYCSYKLDADLSSARYTLTAGQCLDKLQSSMHKHLVDSIPWHCSWHKYI